MTYLTRRKLGFLNEKGTGGYSTSGTHNHIGERSYGKKIGLPLLSNNYSVLDIVLIKVANTVK